MYTLFILAVIVLILSFHFTIQTGTWCLDRVQHSVPLGILTSFIFGAIAAFGPLYLSAFMVIHLEPYFGFLP